ncbi:hypothetical protein Peur_043904 [Populus x canadensis]
MFLVLSLVHQKPTRFQIWTLILRGEILLILKKQTSWSNLVPAGIHQNPQGTELFLPYPYEAILEKPEFSNRLQRPWWSFSFHH